MMTELTVGRVIEAWTSERNQMLETNPEAVYFSTILTDTILKLLSNGEPATAQDISHLAKLPLEEVYEAFALIKQQGGEFNEEGSIVGLALSLNPSIHKFQVNGNQLYTWCALDALFIPGLIDQTAEVQSTCPVTELPINLTVTPSNVSHINPPNTVLSITIPGLSCRTQYDSPDKPKTGPKSDGCSQMFFFSSLKAAEEWVVDHPGIAILTVQEAYQLAYVNWIERRKNIYEMANALKIDLSH